MSAVTQSPYPARCPSCHKPAGWPFSAGTCHRPGVIVIQLRCRECGHEWTTDAHKPAMAPPEFAVLQHRYLNFHVW